MQEQLEKTMEDLQEDVAAAKKALLDARKREPRTEVMDYEFLAWGGTTVLLSELFGEKNDLIIVHNMGESCPYCTLWADGLNGQAGHITKRTAFVVASPDDPEKQERFARQRGWTFPMISVKNSSFTKDMGFEPNPGALWPGYTTFIRDEGRIYRVTSAHFGPGDDYCAPWPMFEHLADGINGWEPDNSYSPTITR
ncbi:MAG: DUF899 family protein [Fimbriimonadaceae bacterium]